MNLKKIFDLHRVTDTAQHVGDFVEVYGTGLKNDGGFAHSIYACSKYGVTPCKGKIEKVISATMQEVLDGSYESRCGRGGSMSDVVEEQKFNYTKEELATFYNLLTLINISDRPNAYFYVDRQGYDYARDLYVPAGWETMFSDIIESEETKENKRDAYEKAEDEAVLQRNWEIYDNIVSQFDGVLVKGGDFAKNMRALIKYFEGAVKFTFSKYRHYGYTLEFEDDAVAQDFYNNVKDLESALYTLYLAPSTTTEDGWTSSTTGVTQFYEDYNIDLSGYSTEWHFSSNNKIKKDQGYHGLTERAEKAFDKYGHADFRETWREQNPFEDFQV